MLHRIQVSDCTDFSLALQATIFKILVKLIFARQRLWSYEPRWTASAVVQNGAIQEGVIGSVPVLHPQFVSEPGAGIQLLDACFPCQECSQNTPPAIQIAEGLVQGCFTRKNLQTGERKKKVLPCQTGETLLQKSTTQTLTGSNSNSI